MLDWLLDGDPVIQYLVKRDLLNEKEDLKKIQENMLKEGWVKTYLEKQNPNGHWGQRFYQPKWISTHYTLLDLALFNAPKLPRFLEIIDKILEEERGSDKGINPSRDIGESDVCINGMFLNYACYFGVEEDKIRDVVDYLFEQKMIDGGFNCRLNRSGAKHSSVHSTICVLEGIERYVKEGYKYRVDELIEVQRTCEEFLLMHQLYKSDKTGEIIHKNMLVFAYPWRYKYNIMRAMYYFASTNRPYDERMKDAIEYIQSKAKDGKWKVAAKHPGKQHMILEPSRQDSRMLTYMATVVLNQYVGNIQK